MKRFVMGLAMVLAFTAFAFAAARNDGSAAESRAEKAANSQKVSAKAKGHSAGAKENATDDARTGDITIKGKAGSVTHISYGQGSKTEPAAGAKGSGQ